MKPPFFGGSDGPSPALPMATAVAAGRGGVFAYSAGAIVGATLAQAPLTPRLSLEGDLGSGGRRSGGRQLGTFNPLFPRRQYFDEAAFFDAANPVDVRPALDLHLGERLLLVADGFLFWRQSLQDGLYGPSNQLLLADHGSRARFVGGQGTARVVWQLDRHPVFEAGYNPSFRGHFFGPRHAPA